MPGTYDEYPGSRFVDRLTQTARDHAELFHQDGIVLDPQEIGGIGQPGKSAQHRIT